MEAYRTRVQIREDGSLTLNDLPFQAGEEVEVIVFRDALDQHYALRGTPLHCVDPFESVAGGDWEVLR